MNDWAEKSRDGDIRALARAATAIENRDPPALRAARGTALAHQATRWSSASPDRRAREKARWSIALARAFGAGEDRGDHRRGSVQRMTGGAILGDRIRMRRTTPIRASSSAPWRRAASLGGLARATADWCGCSTRPGGVRDRRDRRGGTGGSGGRATGGDHLWSWCREWATTSGVQSRHHGDRRHLRDQQSGPCRARERDRARACRACGIARRLDPPIVRTVATEGTGIDELMAAIERHAGSEQAGAPAAHGVHGSITWASRSQVDRRGARVLRSSSG